MTLASVRAPRPASRVGSPRRPVEGTRVPRYEGTIRSTRRVRYRGMEETHVQTQPEPRQGRQVLVDLGPQSKLSNVDLGQGDDVRFLADPVRIGGQPALRAEPIRVGGELVDLDRSLERQRFRTKSKGSERTGGSGDDAQQRH